MSTDNHIKIPAQSSIFSKQKNDRYIDVYYSLPENGVNEDTGVLLYICGFRGFAEANVFKKLRSQAADNHNLITIQCNYFGYEFMQKGVKLKLNDKYKKFFSPKELELFCENDTFNINRALEFIGDMEITLNLTDDLSIETPEYFADMGVMQAMDSINALITVLEKVKDSGCNFNSKKIIAFGNSHGSYLAHLCNLFAPGLISLIIDNSGWLFPRHLLENSRVLPIKERNATFNITFDYSGRSIIDDFEILDLNYMYKGFKNDARVIAFHGEKDHLSPLKHKTKFIKKLNNAEIEPITYYNLGQYEGIFNKTGHGLGANFITLFEHVMSNYNIKFDKNINFYRPNNRYIETNSHRYIINYGNDIPELIKCKK